MRNPQIRPRYWLFALLLAVTAVQPAAAQFYTYSGTGVILRNGTSDPWDIGTGQLPISYSVTIDAATTTDMNLLVANASFFSIFSGSFSIDGVPTEFLDAPDEELVRFFDNEFGIGDSFSTRFRARRNGIEQQIVINYFISNAAWMFTSASELPPVWDTLPITVGVSASGEGSAYNVVTQSGALVTSVPEPASVLGLGLLAAGLCLRRRWC